MSERRPTTEQAAAIGADARAAIVEAGAGTGKTGVMVDRYCRLACEQKLSLDAILAVTFTEKAAAELRQRIRAELARRADEGSERAAELLRELGSAWITTIHGFCHRLLASHPVAAGVDPRFRVLDAPEADRAAREAFDEALELFLDERDQAARLETVAAYRIDALRSMVVEAHAELRSRGTSRPQLPPLPAADVGAAIDRAARVARETLDELGERSRDRPLVERAIETLGARGAGVELDAIASLRSTGRSKETAAYREAIGAAIATVAEAGEGGAAYEHTARLLELFGERFAAVKERRGGIDFEDLQLLAAALLERAEIGGAYRARFSHLMVDEFQDTNRLQVRLIESLRGPGTKLMVVGDALQSIYGFRHADLDAFREQREAIAADPQGKLIELTGNFRSRPELIGAVNALGTELIGVGYQPLRVGAVPEDTEPPGGGPAVELLLTARKGWEGLELEPAIDSGTRPHHVAESRFVAERLRELADKGVPRGEMVVLLRAFTHLDAYEDSLARSGLRPYVVGGRGYWSQQQVSDVCALLATIANPLDDESLFGALASPACGVTPDTLWLLRAASGGGRHVWPAVERTAGLGEGELEAPERLGQIPEGQIALLRRFATELRELRARGTRLPLAELIDRAVTATGYDLAVLLKPAGEARFANVRKLMRIAEEFEAREGRDLRGLLDYLAFRQEAADESSAATAAEDHDGVRIMSVHRAKGLEFGVVAVPHLDRNLLSGGWAPLLTFGRGEDHRVGMQLRRLGAPSINIYDHEPLREEDNARDAAEGLRLFHVAVTRARERLILSGVVKEKGGEVKPSTAMVERIVNVFGVDREEDSTIAVPAPEPRPGLDAAFAASQISVRVNRPSPQRATELVVRHRAPRPSRPAASGAAPLVERRPRAVPRRPLSYSAISDYEECGYRFELERVFGFGREIATMGPDGEPASPSAREERTARGRVVHSLLEWSQANGWRQPPDELLESHASAEGLDSRPSSLDELRSAVRGWLGSRLLRERIGESEGETRAEVQLLLEVEGSVLRGSIDLLVEPAGGAPLVVDYKTDRLGDSDPARHAAGYEIQRSIYALAVAESRGVEEVEVAYVFLERPDDPQIKTLGTAELKAARARLTRVVGMIGAGEFPAAAVGSRSQELCRGCPARGRVCSGPGGPA
ncbi:MAG: UvrD-helicase domain-containing protein [Solirubrobacterales bacterium]